MSKKTLDKSNKVPSSITTIKSVDSINEMLSYDNIIFGRLYSGQLGPHTLAIFVHCSVFNGFKKHMIDHYKVNFINQSYDYKLRVGDARYDMKLVYVNIVDDLIEKVLNSVMIGSMVSFIFLSTPNLFISEKRYHELELFIKANGLEKHIVNIETKPGLIYDASGDTNITVVTFQNIDNWHVIVVRFLFFLIHSVAQPPPAYYITVAFPWLQPSQIEHLRKPIHKKTYFVVHQFLTCLRELSYDKEPHTNLFDLCNLKLAFCDDRSMNDCDAELVYEIESLILRTLKKLKATTNVLKNKQFNVRQYTSERNVLWNEEVVQYFQYSFQNHFSSIIRGLPTQVIFGSMKNLRYSSLKSIKLLDIKDFKIITQFRDTWFEIDCRGFDQMNIYQFFNLIKYRNIKTVILDTNHKWMVSNKPVYLLLISWVLVIFASLNNKINPIYIKCVGENVHNFVESFVSALKTFPIWPQMRLYLISIVPNCAIFNATRFSEIFFVNTDVGSQILEGLYNSKLHDTKLHIHQCGLKNQPNVWDLICAMENLDMLVINEDETTWQCFIEFVAKTVKKSELKEFVLLKKIAYLVNKSNIINLLHFKFTMDDTNSKIIMKHILSHKEVDLYYFRNQIADDKCLYDFYN